MRYSHIPCIGIALCFRVVADISILSLESCLSDLSFFVERPIDFRVRTLVSEPHVTANMALAKSKGFTWCYFNTKVSIITQ